jgi:hypothetical protein
MQERNEQPIELIMIYMTSKDSDKIVYFGVININENGRNIGAVDIWRNAVTRELFCEEKRLGNLDIADNIGMPKIQKDRRWAVLINKKKQGKDKWQLIKISKDGEFEFRDVNDEKLKRVNVKDYGVVDDHWWSFLVEKNINRSVDITG